jgi:hypothetical protein
MNRDPPSSSRDPLFRTSGPLKSEPRVAGYRLREGGLGRTAWVVLSLLFSVSLVAFLGFLLRLAEESRKKADATAEKEKVVVAARPKFEAPAQAPAIFLFEGFDSTRYPQDDSGAEDDALILEHIRKLSPKLEYDPATAAVTLDYTIGVDVKSALKDDPPCKELQQKQHILFEPPVSDRRIEIEPISGKKTSPYSFSANTQGIVAFPVPFRYYVRVELKLSLLALDRTGTFDCLVMYDRTKSESLVAEWLKVGVMKGGVPSVVPLSTGEHAREYGGPADRWFPKTHEVPMLVEYRMPDPDPKRAGKDPLKTGLLTVEFEVGNNLRSATSSYPSKGESLQRGLVGFQWSRVKFQVRDLQITGILDKKAAAEILREKLKLPEKVDPPADGKQKESPAAKRRTG